MKVPEEKDLLRPPEVARKLALSVPTIYRLAQLGKLVCVKGGRAVRFRPADVDRYIRENRKAG